MHVEHTIRPLRNVARGEYVRRKPDSRTTYVRGEYDRATKRFELIDTEDMNRVVYLKPNTPVFIGFTY
jgi:hypothetical protein